MLPIGSVSADMLKEMTRAVTATAVEVTTPLAFVEQGQVYPIGTGTLVQVAGSHFFVTAAHCFREFEQYKNTMHLFDVEGERLTGVPIDGGVHMTDEETDVAVFELTPESAAGIKNRRFLRLDEVSLQPRRPGWGVVCGFPGAFMQQTPTSDNRRTLRLNLVTVSGTITAESQEREAFDPAAGHFLIDVDERGLFWENGERAELPKLHGISGASVWQTWWPGEDTPGEWRSRRMRVVGIQVSVNKKPTAAIKFTEWMAAASIIYQKREDLRAVMEFHFPEIRGQFG